MAVMATHIRKHVSLPRELDDQVRDLAKRRRISQSGLIAHLVRLGLTSPDGEGDALLRYVGSLEGPVDLSESVDATVYRR